MKTISIAMATYNGAQYIAQQLDSLAKQTVLPNELIITDDNSTDDTAAVVAKFAATAPFPVHFEKNAEKLGFRGNFMKAAGLCKSELISFCDQDDIWLPEKLAKCRAAFDNQDVLLTYNNASVTDEKLNPIGNLDKMKAPTAVNLPQSIGPWTFGLGFTQVFHRKLLTFAVFWPTSVDFYLFKEREAHDQWFFYLASALGTIVYMQEPLALYRQHQKNVTGWGGPKSIKSSLGNITALGIDGIKSRELCAGRRAAVFEWAKNNFEPNRAARANAAALGYRKLESHYRARREMYESRSVASRLRTVRSLFFDNGYVPVVDWGVGRKAFLKDLVRSFVW